MTDLDLLQPLAERLEKAAGPDRELDLAIARALVPDVICLRHDEEIGTNEPFTHWEFTGSIDDAARLCDRLLPDIKWCVESGGWAAIGNRMSETSTADAATPALALCLALIRALIERERAP
jgi:hypothetical protein